MINATTPEALTQTKIDFGENLSLLFRGTGSEPSDYPTNRIQKGLIIFCGNKKLGEEGVGFGVPIIKTGYETIFPGSAQINLNKNGDVFILSVNYHLNLVNRMKMRSKRIESEAFYRIKDYLASVHRRYPALRGTGTNLSNILRRICGIRNFFEIIPSEQIVKVIYTIQVTRKNIQIDVDLRGVRIEGNAEITIANEQGANYFAKYQDSNGVILLKDDIGTWNEISAEEASLVDSDDHVLFSLPKVQGARMFRGRELVSDRLAWSGLNYVLSEHINDFHYNIQLGGPK